MGRIIAIDYGAKRCGLAWTDPTQTIATALPPCETSQLEPLLNRYFAQESIDALVLGYPTNLKGEATHGTALVENFRKRLAELFPTLRVEYFDERFTSKIALQTMIAAGVPKQKRAEKNLINSVSAVVILQDYLQKNQ